MAKHNKKNVSHKSFEYDGGGIGDTDNKDIITLKVFIS